MANVVVISVRPCPIHLVNSSERQVRSPHRMLAQFEQREKLLAALLGLLEVKVQLLKFRGMKTRFGSERDK